MFVLLVSTLITKTSNALTGIKYNLTSNLVNQEGLPWQVSLCIKACYFQRGNHDEPHEWRSTLMRRKWITLTSQHHLSEPVKYAVLTWLMVIWQPIKQFPWLVRHSIITMNDTIHAQRQRSHAPTTGPTPAAATSRLFTSPSQRLLCCQIVIVNFFMYQLFTFMLLMRLCWLPGSRLQ